MSLESLQALLTKEAIVGTQAVDRLSQAPQVVEEAYLHHVRSYVPLGRIAEGDEETLTVSEFEKRLIRLVKDGKAPTGYVTAEYGYGKTSTCLYLWQRCREANLVAVPPFEFTHLPDLISATHAWVSYELSRVKPDLIGRASEIRSRYETRSLEDLAKQNNMSIDGLRDLYAKGQLVLTLAPILYVQFFEEMTALVADAGFDGLVILPDELQQYLEPQIKSGIADPIVPLFDIVQGMLTRRGTLRCGLIFSIPARELAVLNEQRGDFVQRLKGQGLGFDLRNVYTAEFATQLWERLSNQFDFRAEHDAMVHPDALRAIGEIAARPDLASGPRTVVAIFQRIVDRYLHPHADGRRCYAPIDLIDDYLAGAIPFDETGKIQRVVNGRLAASVVAGHPDRERVIRLIAAFPTEGCPRRLLQEYDLATAADDLAAAGQGDLIIFLGAATSPGMTLRGLEPQHEGPTDWLTATLREFGRNYVDTAGLTISRAEDGFERLLINHFFKASDWKIITRFERRLTQNRGLLLEGSFASTTKLYPQRRVHVRLLREEESGIKSADADLVIDFVLCTHFDQPLEQRWAIAGSIDRTDPRHLRLELNLAHHTTATLRTDLHNKLQPVVNPYKICPLLLLSLDEYLEEKRRNDQMPRSEDDLIKNTFQFSLVDECIAELWNRDLIGPQGTTGTKLLEALLLDACRQLFPNYKTLMPNSLWQAALRDYRRALGDLRSQSERQGELAVDGTKTEIAPLFGRANTGFDSFVSSFPTLIKIEQEFRGNNRGAVSFTLHPLETAILNALKQSPRKVNLSMPGFRPESVPALTLDDVYRLAAEQGYRDRETEEILDIMLSRTLIARQDQQGSLIALAPPRVPSINELAEAIKTLQAQINPLADFYGGYALSRYKQKLEEITHQELPALRHNPDEHKVAKIYGVLRTYDLQMKALQADKLATLRSDLQRLALPTSATSSQLPLLAAPMSLELFGRHLESIRQEVQRDYTQLEKSHAEIGADLEKMRNTASLEVTPTELVQLATQARAWDERARKAQSTGNDLDGKFFAFVQASTLLDNAIRLQHRLLELNTLMAPCQAEFDNLMRDINAAFTARRREALRDISLWDKQFAQVQQCAAELEQARRAEFENWQHRYHALLKTHLNLAHDNLPRIQTHNPANPRESRDRLSAEVQQVIKNALNGLLQECRATQRKLAAIAYSGALGELPDDENGVAVERAEQCQALLGNIQQEATLLVGQAADDGSGIFDEPSSAFEQFCRSLGQARTKARHMADLLRQIEGALAEARLTEPEQHLLEAISALAGRDSQVVDLGMALQYSGQPIATVMALLGSLYTKRRLYVAMQPAMRLQPGGPNTAEVRGEPDSSS